MCNGGKGLLMKGIMRGERSEEKREARVMMSNERKETSNKKGSSANNTFSARVRTALLRRSNLNLESCMCLVLSCLCP